MSRITSQIFPRFLRTSMRILGLAFLETSGAYESPSKYAQCLHLPSPSLDAKPTDVFSTNHIILRLYIIGQCPVSLPTIRHI